MTSPLYLFLRQIFYGLSVGVATGCASALFLSWLALSTEIRNTHRFLLYLLPLAGVACVELYRRYGNGTEAGNNLILERIHEAEGDPIPFRMAPLVLICTLLTHVCGGSAGREGTAVQVGGALAEGWGRLLKVGALDRKILLMAGVSGGFGSVFGTPLAGAVFGMEVLTFGKIETTALVACLSASLTGHLVCTGLGTVHHLYPMILAPALTPKLWLLIAGFGVLCGIIARVFILVTHGVADLLKRWISVAWVRPLLGGIIVIALVHTLKTYAYLGLSLGLIESSFTPGGVVGWAFALKILFTAITLGSGFKGGEVTPLFCVGATLGSAFAALTHTPTSFFAALGFVAVFAGAAKTPLTCLLLGIELFGGGASVPFFVVCGLAAVASGSRGIYHAQR